MISTLSDLLCCCKISLGLLVICLFSSHIYRHCRKLMEIPCMELTLLTWIFSTSRRTACQYNYITPHQDSNQIIKHMCIGHECHNLNLLHLMFNPHHCQICRDSNYCFLTTATYTPYLYQITRYRTRNLIIELLFTQQQPQSQLI